jgi:hypothetical protein
LVGREDLVKDNKVGDGENDVEIADCADFFLINYIDRGIEDFVEDGENDVRIADYVRSFLVSYADRGAVLPYFANFVIIITAAKTASIY